MRPGELETNDKQLVEKDDDLIEERDMEQLENTVEKEGLEINANEKVEDDDLTKEKKTEQLERAVEKREELEINASE